VESNGKGEWRGDKVTCELDSPAVIEEAKKEEVQATTTPSSSSSSNGGDPNESPEFYEYESCRIDTSSILISYSNSLNTQFPSVNDFVFLNGTIGVEHGTSVSYYCKSNSFVTYQARCNNGTLLMEQNCNELKASKSACSSPPKIPHGYNKYSSSLHGSKALYQCFNGFEMSKGDSELRCSDGEWVGSIPVCSKVNCAYPGPLENGKIFYIGTIDEYIYKPYMNSVGQNKQIRYECFKSKYIAH
jgi:hypothetical protein